MLVALLVSLALMPYWPGAPSTATDSAPAYDHRIPVIDTLKPLDNLGPALREWNTCGSVQLFRANEIVPYTPGSITITRPDPEWGWGEGAWGGWSEDHGVVYLTAGWTRSREVLEHEIGHALGFGHAKDGLLGGFTTIMAAGAHVSAWDCAGLRSYYG